MKWSRRAFLEVGTAGLAGLCLGGFRTLASRQPRMGLFFGVADVPLLRDYLRMPRFSEIYRTLSAAPAHLQTLLEEVDYKQGFTYILPVSERVMQTALYALLSEEPQATQQALEGVRALMRFPRWDYVIEEEQVIGLERASAATLATAVVLDWLGTEVTTDERTRWLRALRDRGIETCYLALYRMHHPETMREWKVDPLSGYFIFNQAPPPGIGQWPIALYATGAMAAPLEGLVIGMLAYAHYAGMDQRMGRWNQQAVSSFDLLRKLFLRDGTFLQGVSIAADVAPRLVRITEAVARRTGEDFFDRINWQGFVTSLRELSLSSRVVPHGYLYLGDAEVAATAAVSRWVARRARDPYAQWTADMLQQEDMWSLIWYLKRVKSIQPHREPHIWISDAQWAVARTGHGLEDLVVGMVSGSSFTPLRADRNSLILKAYGEPLVVTPPLSPPALPLAARETATFSALLVDARGQWIPRHPTSVQTQQLASRLMTWGTRPGYAFWKSDASEAYRAANADIRSVTRSVIVLWQFPAVIVLDKVQKASQASVLEARFFVDNRDAKASVEVEESNGVARVMRPAAGMGMYGFAIGGVSVQKGMLAAGGEELPFVAFRTDTPSRNPLLITVLLPVPLDGQGALPSMPQAAISLNPDGVYVVRIHGRGKERICRIMDTAEAPEFDID